MPIRPDADRPKRSAGASSTACQSARSAIRKWLSSRRRRKSPPADLVRADRRLSPSPTGPRTAAKCKLHDRADPVRVSEEAVKKAGIVDDSRPAPAMIESVAANGEIGYDQTRVARLSSRVGRHGLARATSRSATRCSKAKCWPWWTPPRSARPRRSSCRPSPRSMSSSRSLRSLQGAGDRRCRAVRSRRPRPPCAKPTFACSAPSSRWSTSACRSRPTS